MANEEQLAILRQGVEVWNRWRKENPNAKIDLNHVDLNDADLIGVNLNRANLEGAAFRRARLSDNQTLYQRYLGGFGDFNGTSFAEANLLRADFSEADLGGIDLSWANLNGTNLKSANLRVADLSESYLRIADLRGADLCGANLSGAQLNQADLRGADLTGANLEGSILVGAKIDKAKISTSNIYGISVWDLDGDFEEQKDLIITPEEISMITVDNIKVAQFVYLILNNEEIRDVINTITTKAVLILGRFYEERKQVLDTLKDALRKRGFVPILFDFAPSKRRDLTETIQLLANMSKFVIADVTDAKSIPQELSHIIPLLPSVPVQPILLISKEKEYPMFEHWRSFNTVLPEYLYRDKQDLLDNLDNKILEPIVSWRKDQNDISILQNRIKQLEAQLRDGK